jgi:surface antigen
MNRSQLRSFPLSRDTERDSVPLLRRAAGVAAVAVVASGTILAFAAPASAVGTYSTTGAVNVRSGPGTTYPIVGSAPSGAAFTLVCQTQSGTNVNGNSTWDRVQFSNGVSGTIADYWTTTPSWNSYAPGTPDCNVAPPPPAAGSPIGGVNMQAACDIQYPGQGRRAVVLDAHNAYSWVCASGAGNAGINVNGACATQYGYGATSGLTDASNPYTWYCRWSTPRTVGATRDYNAGFAGQCTFGANDRFHATTGRYGAWSGDAWQWATSAKATGWTVVPNAQARSIVVFQPGIQGAGRYGHVAWVDSVESRSDGLYIHVTEMNWVGVGLWSHRVVKDVAGMSYILAP